jgi:hypothetical protein
MQYKMVFYDRFLIIEKDKKDLEKIVLLRYKRNIEDYMIKKTYYNMKLGLKDPAMVI